MVGKMGRMKKCKKCEMYNDIKEECLMEEIRLNKDGECITFIERRNGTYGRI